jgi:hypothetical protein
MHNGNHFGARGNIFPALQCHGSKTRAAAWNVDKVPKAMPKVGKTIDIPPFLISPFFGDDSINTFHIAPDGKNENWVDDDRCGSGYLLAHIAEQKDLGLEKPLKFCLESLEFRSGASCCWISPLQSTWRQVAIG